MGFTSRDDRDGISAQFAITGRFEPRPPLGMHMGRFESNGDLRTVMGMFEPAQHFGKFVTKLPRTQYLLCCAKARQDPP